MTGAIWLPLLLLPASLGIKQGLEIDEFPLLMPAVKPDREETYLCTPIRLDTDLTFFIVGFKPNASMHTAHHMLIYGCEEPGSEAPVWNCGEMSVTEPGLSTSQPCMSGPQVIYAWGMDAPELQLPDDVGFRVGADSSIKYLVLQVHYAHVDKIGSGDKSGVIVEYTEVEQPKTAGVLLLGTGGFAVAHSTTYFETACQLEDDRDIHPFAFRTHTHGLGKLVSGWRVRDNSQWKLIGKKNPQLPQMFYPVEDGSMVIRPGDVVAARCTMVNTKDKNVYIGSTNEHEMCNYYLMYWVHGHRPVHPRTCFTRGPPLWSWGGRVYGAGLDNIPDLEASIP